MAGDAAGAVNNGIGGPDRLVPARGDAAAMVDAIIAKLGGGGGNAPLEKLEKEPASRCSGRVVLYDAI
jgi:hypothetical protein